jgi:hypothetical protein
MPQTERLDNHCWHLEHIPGTQIKITQCCACKAKKVTDAAKKEKLDLGDIP